MINNNFVTYGLMVYVVKNFPILYRRKIICHTHLVFTGYMLRSFYWRKW